MAFRDGSLKDVRWPTSTWPADDYDATPVFQERARNLTAYGQLSGGELCA